MTELRRLLDGESDELALEILRSAGDDSPSTDSLKATALALGISGGLGGSALLASGLRAAATPSAAVSGAHAVVAGAQAGTSGVASLTAFAIVKQMAIGIAAGVLTIGGVQLVSEHPFSETAKPSQSSLASARVSSPQSRSRTPSQLSGPSAPVLAAEGADALPQPSLTASPAAPVARRRSAATGAVNAGPTTLSEAKAPESVVAAAPVEAPKEPEAAKSPVALNKSLAAEVALLDRARNALLAQNPSGALRALEQYRKERQTAILEPEANVLQIQVLDKLGEHGAAVRLARAFVQSYPESRHVESLRALAAEAP